MKSVPRVVKLDKQCWTHEPEFDRYVMYHITLPVVVVVVVIRKITKNATSKEDASTRGKDRTRLGLIN